MQKRGWKSEDTLNKAKKELIAASMIAETRKGGFPNRTTLYGLTWFRLDHCAGKLDVSPIAFPYGAFCAGEIKGIGARIAPRTGTALNTLPVANKVE